MSNVLVIMQRELAAYFTSPLAYVFITVFLAMAGGLTFFLGNFLERGQANLDAFFSWHPWLYLFLIPAIGMRLWAEERKSGTVEFLLTLPISTTQAVLGKYLAAWLFAGIALALTFPIWITVNYLGNPDNGVIAATYIGSWLLAGAFLGISAAVSALTKNQVIAFVGAAAVCFLFLMSGLDLVQGAVRGWAPEGVAEALAGYSLLSHFQSIAQGVIDLRDIIFFATLTGLSLFINKAALDLNKGA